MITPFILISDRISKICHPKLIVFGLEETECNSHIKFLTNKIQTASEKYVNLRQSRKVFTFYPA